VNYKTYGELKLKVQRETDTEAEDFVQDDELMSYFQDAVNEAEAHIHKLGLEDDYFLKRDTFDLTLGQESISLPTDIYANKIRSLVFKWNDAIYPVKRLKGQRRFLLAENLLLEDNATEHYGYIIINNGPDVKPVLQLYPTAKHVGTDLMIMHYIRNAVEIVDEDSIVDIPEFYSFITAFVKWKIFSKEGSALRDAYKAELDEQKTLMLQTLEQMVPDNDNIIEAETDHYEVST
jgi:hypothetical protein